ncbi:MAG TPA: hypothetical protein VGD90_12335 [Sphingobacteriaceae bacterium]
MNNRNKKIFLALSIAIPFLVYCFYYYGVMLKNAPYRFSDFESVTLKYGMGTNLINQYDSRTGAYQYENTRDSLVKTKVKLTKDDLLYLHRKAAELGFWNMPDVIEGADQTRPTPHYYLEFKYKEKTKTMLFDLGYMEKPKLRAAAKAIIDEVSNKINEAEDRGKGKE